jgi:ubiquitin C-terminal hydrolase
VTSPASRTQAWTGANPASVAAAEPASAALAIHSAARGGEAAETVAPHHSSSVARGPRSCPRDAIKLLQVTSAPPVLTIHLKRFASVGRTVKKVGRHVAFPIHLNALEQHSDGHKTPPKAWEQLDPKRSRMLGYELFGVVEHSGTYRDGHYTAYVRVGGSDAARAAAGDSPRSATSWNLFSDAKVTAVTEQQVLNAQAFLLFYARAETPATSRAQ